MVLVDQKQLSPVDVRRARAKPAASEASAVPGALARAHAAATIDLHGLTAEEAVAALDSFINEAILAGLAEGRVIHGRSGGRLKTAVHARLKVIPSIRGFRLDPANPGVTIVTF